VSFFRISTLFSSVDLRSLIFKLSSLVAELTVKTLETPLTEESLKLALKPTLAAKQYGSEDLLASLVSEAVLAVMPKNPTAVRKNSDSSVQRRDSLIRTSSSFTVQRR